MIGLPGTRCPRRIDDRAAEIGDATHRHQLTAPIAARTAPAMTARRWHCRYLLNLALTSRLEALNIMATGGAAQSVVRCP
jgi:hypothetical protein